MKNQFLFFLLLITTILIPLTSNAQIQVETSIVQSVNTNFRGAAVVLTTVELTVAEAGKVVVNFDGNCVSSEGDRIILAASNTSSWSVNDGHTAVEAYDSDINRHSFSHTRVYDVTAGTHTFYAVGQNFVETDGSGIASVYARLTAKFYPNSGPAIVAHTGIIDVNRDLSSGVETIATVDFNVPEDGKVHVKFNGMCVGDPDDLIVIAASNNAGWTVNDGNTGIEAISNDLNTRVFSHSRVYDVTPGVNTFYAVAQNFVETGGDGMASFYASLTAIFYPNGYNLTLDHVGINETNLNTEGAPVTVGVVSINPGVSGTAIVTFDGLCASSPGDRMVMAASNNESWSANSGNVNVEAISADLNYNNFSHTQVYDIAPGSHTFYAVVQNFVETAGNGIGSFYASLTVAFCADEIPSGIDDATDMSRDIEIFPNPASDFLFINIEKLPREKYVVELIDASGRLLDHTSPSYETYYNFDLTEYSTGNYLIRILGETSIGIRQISVY